MLWPLLLAMAVICAGCTTLVRPPPSLPTWPAALNAGTMDALIAGRLVIDPVRGCVWLRNGQDQDIWVQWPPGFSLVTQIEPARVTSPSGVEILEGEAVRLTGGYMPTPADPCATGSDWWVAGSIAPP